MYDKSFPIRLLNIYFKANTLQALEAESRRGEGPTLNLSSHSSPVRYKLGLGWSTSFLVCETGVILPTSWGFEHQADAHHLLESGVPAILICSLRVASLNFCSVSMSELLAHSLRGCSGSCLREMLGKLFHYPCSVLSPFLASLEGCVRFHVV